MGCKDGFRPEKDQLCAAAADVHQKAVFRFEGVADGPAVIQHSFLISGKHLDLQAGFPRDGFQHVLGIDNVAQRRSGKRIKTAVGQKAENIAVFFQNRHQPVNSLGRQAVGGVNVSRKAYSVFLVQNGADRTAFNAVNHQPDSVGTDVYYAILKKILLFCVGSKPLRGE